MFGQYLKTRRIKKERHRYIKSLIRQYFPKITPHGRQKDFYTAFGDTPNFSGRCQLSIPNADVRTIHSYLMQDYPRLCDPTYLLMVSIDYTASGHAEITIRCDQRNICVSTVY